MGSVGGGNGNINITPIIHIGGMGESNNIGGMEESNNQETWSNNNMIIKPRITGGIGSLNNNQNNNNNNNNNIEDSKRDKNNSDLSSEGGSSTPFMDGLKTVGGLLVKKLGGM